MRPGRALYLAAGVVSVGLGTLGIALPLLPSVPFFLLAAFCFARSKPEWERRMLDHPRYGASLRDWRERRAIPRRAKRTALATMAAGAVPTWMVVGWPWALATSAVLAIAGTWIWTRPD